MGWNPVRVVLGAAVAAVALSFAPSGPAVAATHHPRVPMRHALEASPSVVRWMIGTTHPRGRFLCGFDRLGHSRATGERYLWVQCGDYVAGRPVSDTTASAGPVVVTTRGRLDDLTLTDVRFLREDATAADVHALLPPRPARQALRRTFDVRPTDQQLHDSL